MRATVSSSLGARSPTTTSQTLAALTLPGPPMMRRTAWYDVTSLLALCTGGRTTALFYLEEREADRCIQPALFQDGPSER
jgi:hypothetical protein